MNPSPSAIVNEAGEKMSASAATAPLPPKLALQPLNTNVSLREQAYAALKQAIMDADIYAHREEIRLDERQLSQALGVSRTPIRDVSITDSWGIAVREKCKGQSSWQHARQSRKSQYFST